MITSEIETNNLLSDLDFNPLSANPTNWSDTYKRLKPLKGLKPFKESKPLEKTKDSLSQLMVSLRSVVFLLNLRNYA